MRLSSKQSCRFCRSCRALPNNLISLLPTCLIAMDFDDDNDDDDDTEFNAAAGAILAITSATATAIATLILPILMELNDSPAARKTARMMTRHGFNAQ